uniref:Uncharacterized protein n=1 Tax=Anopheles atroparvus TaxID=41427 RepID=A0AAG5CVI6_ANOAO
MASIGAARCTTTATVPPTVRCFWSTSCRTCGSATVAAQYVQSITVSGVDPVPVRPVCAIAICRCRSVCAVTTAPGNETSARPLHCGCCKISSWYSSVRELPRRVSH